MSGTPKITLVLGGARSGKSEIAEKLAASAEPPVTYLATARIVEAGGLASEIVEAGRLASEIVEAGGLASDSVETGGLASEIVEDPEWAQRVALHRARRPPSWKTVEVAEKVGGGLVEALAESAGTVLVDSLGSWVAGSPRFEVDVDGLLAVLRARTGRTILVAEEVGLGVHPSTEAGVRFRDALGRANRRVAEVSDEVLLVVAGCVLHLDPARPPTA
jgi:adenosylcobinamide kinase/adenosylcobinamide-phosphate guanylyltransferase